MHNRHLLRCIFATLVISTLQANKASAQASDQKPAGDLLIDAAILYQSKIEKILMERASVLAESARSGEAEHSLEMEIVSINERRPIEESLWKMLEIGEFESESAFRARVDAAKSQEEQAFQKAMRSWEEELTSAQSRLSGNQRKNESQAAAIKSRENELNKKIESIKSTSSTMPSLVRIVTIREVTLPKFNRDTLSFEPVLIAPMGSVDLQSSTKNSLFARLEEMELPRLKISAKSMEAARLFKEGFENGHVSCVVIIGTDLVATESPVIVRPEIVKEEETVMTKENGAKFLGTIALGVVVQAFGASPETMQNLAATSAYNPNLQIKNSKVRKVVQSEIKVEGTRYHYVASPSVVAFLDSNNKKIKDIEVSFTDNFLEVEDFESTVQEAARVLKPGDQIVAVAGTSTYDQRGLQTLVRCFDSDRTYEVTYRRSGSQEILKFTAKGGCDLGVRFKKRAKNSLGDGER